MNGPVQALPGDDPEQEPTQVKHMGRTNDNWYSPSDVAPLETRRSNRGNRYNDNPSGFNPHHDDLEPSRFEEYVDNPSNSAGMLTSTRDLERFLRVATDNGIDTAQRAQIMADILEETKRKAQQDRDLREFDLVKKRKWMDFKMTIVTVFLVLFVLFFIVFIGVFVYLAMTTGILSEGGFITGFFTTIQEVLKIILSSN